MNLLWRLACSNTLLNFLKLPSLALGSNSFNSFFLLGTSEPTLPVSRFRLTPLIRFGLGLHGYTHLMKGAINAALVAQN